MDAETAIARAERRAARAVVRALVDAVGVAGTARVVARVAFESSRGEPFARLGAPVDERERLSRRQAAPLVLLARAVERQRDRTTAVAVARTAAIAGGQRFLSLMIPPEPSIASAAAAVARFFNAEGDTAFEDDTTLAFTVTRCRFVELLAAIGESHLAPIFCEVDAHYFADRTQPIRLGRTTTLATGGPTCDFRFHID